MVCISPGKDIYYGTLRCCTIPRQQPAPQFLQQVFLLPIQFFFPMTETFCYYNLAKFLHIQYPSDKAEARIYMVASAMLVYKERNQRIECASISSHCSSHCYAAILIGKMDGI